MCIVCGFVAAWPLPPLSLNALQCIDVYNLFGRGFVPCVPLCPAFPGRLFGLIACLKTRVFAVCLRRPCRLALSAGRLLASARFCAKQNILCFLLVGLLLGVCCCVLTAKILSFICTNSRRLIFQFSRNWFFPGLLWAFLSGALWPLLVPQQTQDEVLDGVPIHMQRVNHVG